MPIACAASLRILTRLSALIMAASRELVVTRFSIFASGFSLNGLHFVAYRTKHRPLSILCLPLRRFTSSLRSGKEMSAT
jgi:hypothetical protein